MTPSESVLVFDGHCGFCTRSVEWLKPRVGVPIRYEPFQWGHFERYGLSEDQVKRAVWWVTPEGRVYGGARAVGQALLEVGGAWRVVAWLTIVPPARWVAALVYWLVSRNRKRFPGTTPACRRDHWDSRQPPTHG
jgi:predicted DCC family thiol-disulfide oxidoreductase YuxK